MHDIFGRYQAVKLLGPQTVTSTTSGTGVDLGPGFEADAVAHLNIGACSGAATTATITIEGSATLGGSYATISTFTALGPTDGSKQSTARVARFGAAQRFVRATVTVTGASPSYLVSVVLFVKVLLAKETVNSTTAA